MRRASARGAYRGRLPQQTSRGPTPSRFPRRSCLQEFSPRSRRIPVDDPRSAPPSACPHGTGRPLRHRPRLQRPVNRQPEIVVQPRRGVLLHYERTSVLFRWTGLQPQLGHRLRQARASAVTPPALSRVRGSGARNLFYLRFCSRGFVPPFPARLETATLRVAPLRSCRLGRAVKLPLPPILFQLTHRFVRLRFLSALDLCSLYTPAYALRLPIPAVLQASPGSVSREPAPRGLRALQRRLSGTARRLE